MCFLPFPFLFLPHWSEWLLHSVAPGKTTGAGMRSEREQLIKSSSSHNGESQFCSLSKMISFYLRVMSYGIFALGNTMSSINVFHLLHKQEQVIPASFNLHNQSNWLHCQERELGEQKAAEHVKDQLNFFSFFYGSQHSGKTNDGHYLNHLHALVCVCVSLSDDGGAAWITDITLGILLTEVAEVPNLANMAHRMCTRRLRFWANAVWNKQEQIRDNSSTVLSEKIFSCLIWVFSHYSLKSQLLSVVVGFLHLL